MGLLDKAKGLYTDHKDQIQGGLGKAKETVNKAGESVSSKVSKRLPNTGTMTPVGQPEHAEEEASEAAHAETEAGEAAKEV